MGQSDHASEARPELALPPEIRRQLGLSESETLHVLDTGSRTILIERNSAAAASALPWDRDLVLSADVRSFPLAEILGLVHGAGKSGFLYFSHFDQAKAVYVHRGEVVFASSNLKVDRLGECLLRAGVVTLEQLRAAERVHVPDTRFGRIFVERGVLTPRELWHGVKYQVEEIVRSLFSYTSGRVYFWEGEVQPDNVVRLSLPTGRLVTEGLQRRDELLRFLALLEDPRVRLKPVEGADKNLASSERDVFEALRGEPTFAGVRRRIGLDPLSAARTIQLLRLVGAVKLSRVRDDGSFVGEADLRTADEGLVRECVDVHVNFLAELAAPIVAVEGPTGLRDRLGRVLSEVAERFPDLLAGMRVGPHVTLDPEELSRRALRLPGDRRKLAASALGELVAYLEFELKNHPRIPDPDLFLSDVGDLHAKIEEAL